MHARSPVLTASLLVAGSAALAAVAPDIEHRAPSAARGCPATRAAPPPVVKAPATPDAPRAREDRASTPEDHLRRARSFLLRGEPRAAEEALKACLELAPDQPVCHRTLGGLYAGIGQPRDAVRHLRRYVDLKPRAPDARAIRKTVERLERMLPAAHAPRP